MEHAIEQMLASYERGTLSRRALVRGLALIATQAPGAEPVFQPVSVNHITVRVADMSRSVDFYEKVFGSAVSRGNPHARGFRFGGSGFALIPVALSPDAQRGPGVDHVCVSVRGFSLDSAKARMKRHGLEPLEYYRQDQLYFRDPDGVLLQLAADSNG